MLNRASIEPAIFTSLGLSTLCEVIQEIPSCDILELGPVRGDNINFWSQYSPSVYIADLHSSLPLPAMPQDPDITEAREPDWKHLINLPTGRRFDVILAWDLLNYLELTEAESLIRYLSPFCKNGTLFFALIFDQKQMPEEITVYRIVDSGHLRYERASFSVRDCPRHQPRSLIGIMHQFRPANSYRLQNGIVEYLFSYDGGQRRIQL